MEENSQPERLAADAQMTPAVTSTNIVRYERRAGQALQLSGVSPASEVVFIDEDTPTPPVPPPRRHVPFQRRPGTDDEVLYIGPD